MPRFLFVNFEMKIGLCHDHLNFLPFAKSLKKCKQELLFRISIKSQSVAKYCKCRRVLQNLVLQHFATNGSYCTKMPRHSAIGGIFLEIAGYISPRLMPFRPLFP